MRLPVAGFLILGSWAAPSNLAAQSSLLTALEGSAPAPVLEPAVAALTKGLAGLWSDPSVDARAVGVFFGVQRASYASVQVVHAAIAFRLGPRWSLAFASTDLGNLFDSSLTNQDPSLSSLRAQAAWGRLDATITLPRFVTSLGLALAGDDNVGVSQSSTVARVHVRITPFQTDRIMVGLQGSRAVGGSMAAQPSGRRSIDLTFKRAIGASSLSIAAAASRGALWRYSETQIGYALAAQWDAHSRLGIGAALGRYSTTYGVSRWEWNRSVTASLRVGRLRLGTRYTSTRLGLGSAFGVSLGYEPASAGSRDLIAR
jgi:hypothetical protein